MKKTILYILALYLGIGVAAQSTKKVYWVGHSLISHTDYMQFGTKNLIGVFAELCDSAEVSNENYQHTTPGAPLGWNWGANPDAWSSSRYLIDPLINASHGDYGTYSDMVITEGVNIEASYEFWQSSFYARKFFNAAKNANLNTGLYLYESWHHYNAADSEYLDYYGGNRQSFDWMSYQDTALKTWEKIADQAADPSKTQAAPDYSFQGTGTDPGNGSGMLDIKIIPCGQVLKGVLQRLAEGRSADDWTYSLGHDGSTLKDVDFFQNALVNFPSDLSTRVYPSLPVDDIHASNILIYLNALTHFAVINNTNPAELPALNGVPENIASIFKEVVWEVVTQYPRTGVSRNSSSVAQEVSENKRINAYPNPVKDVLKFSQCLDNQLFHVYNQNGKEVRITLAKDRQSADVSGLPAGIYTFFLQNSSTLKFIKL